MYKILITGAGSTQTNGVVNCLLDDKESCEIIGVGSDPYDLMFCRAHKRYLIPHSTKPDYKEAFLKVLDKEKPDIVHFQHDVEMAIALKFADEIKARGCILYVPDYETVERYDAVQEFPELGFLTVQMHLVFVYLSLVEYLLHVHNFLRSNRYRWFLRR